MAISNVIYSTKSLSVISSLIIEAAKKHTDSYERKFFLFFSEILLSSWWAEGAFVRFHSLRDWSEKIRIIFSKGACHLEAGRPLTSPNRPFWPFITIFSQAGVVIWLTFGENVSMIFSLYISKPPPRQSPKNCSLCNKRPEDCGRKQTTKSRVFEEDICSTTYEWTNEKEARKKLAAESWAACKHHLVLTCWVLIEKSTTTTTTKS